MKHAYLIIAHNDFELLKTQLKLIDDTRNDIYIHIDTKSDFENFNDLKDCIKEAKINIYKKINIRWGHSSQVECEMFLLKEATNQYKYKYYHILSGVDLPIKTQNEIHDFFDKNKGKEFIHFDFEKVSEECIDRVMYRHLFSKYYKISKSKILNKIILLMDNILVKLQKILRMKKKIVFKELQKGCNWCSITDEFARYVIQQEKKVKEMIKYSKCADEIFIQTILHNSIYKQNLYMKDYNDNYESCARLIIWDSNNKKSPHTFTINDWDIIKNSNAIFARKFNTSKDINIIKKICSYLKER